MTSCQVCQETAIGFYCGAIVCEACKKFFVRCLKLDLARTFKCSGEGRCPVNRWTRTKCPYCRMKRCLDLNMYAPGNQSGMEDLCNLPCQVCGAPSSGFHFGAYTCEGCKGFFRKCLIEENFVIPPCQRLSTEGRKCHITSETRNDCKFCRFEKCLRIGMDLKKVRIGRQSNLIKHKTNQFLEKLKSKSECIQIDANISSKLAQLLNSEKKNISRPHMPHRRRNEATSTVIAATSIATTTSAQIFASPSADDDGDDDADVHPNDIIKVISQDVIPACGRRNNVYLNRGRSRGQETTRKVIVRTSSETVTTTTFQLARYSSNKSYLTTSPRITYGINSQCPLSLLDEDIPGRRVRDCDFNIWLDIVSTKQRDIIHYVTESYDFLDCMFYQGCPTVAVQELSTENLFGIFVNCLMKAVPAIFSFATRISEVLPSLCMPEVVKELEKNRCLLSPKIFFAIICFLSAQKYDSERDLVNFMGMDETIMSVILERFHSMKAMLPTFRMIGESTAPLSFDKTELSFLCSIFVMDMYNMSACKSILIDFLESYESFNQRNPSRFVRVLSKLRIFFLLVELRKLAIFSITSESNAGSFALPIPTTYQHMFSEPAWSL